MLYSPKDPQSRLWSLLIADHPYPTQTTKQIGSIVTNSAHAERTAYTSASMGSPPDSTLLNAFSKKYIDMHNITLKMIRQNPPPAIATAQGHLRLHKKDINSTKIREYHSTNTHHDRAQFATNAFSASNIASGKFPVTSFNGNNYIVVSAYKDNIHLEAIPVMTGPALQHALTQTMSFFADHGHIPRNTEWTIKHLQKFTKYSPWTSTCQSSTIHQESIAKRHSPQIAPK